MPCSSYFSCWAIAKVYTIWLSEVYLLQVSWVVPANLRSQGSLKMSISNRHNAILLFLSNSSSGKVESLMLLLSFSVS